MGLYEIGKTKDGKPIKAYFDGRTIKEDYVKQDLIEFVKSIKRKSKSGMDKHLCDHLLWMIKGDDMNE